MSLTTTETPTMASMSEVVMKKDELLKYLVENKAKHDVVLATAIAGYWDTAQTQMEKRKQKFYAQLDEFKGDIEREFQKVTDKIAQKQELPASLSIRAINIDAHLGLAYPEDHSTDYDRAISMMKSSVFEQVRLSVDEYDAYVLNNWEWKKRFITSNSFYVDTMRLKNTISGMSYTGCMPSAYARASEDTIKSISEKGLQSSF